MLSSKGEEDAATEKFLPLQIEGKGRVPQFNIKRSRNSPADLTTGYLST